MRTPFVQFTAPRTLCDTVVKLADRPFTNIVLLAGPRGSGRSSALELARRQLKTRFKAVVCSPSSDALVPLFARPVPAPSSGSRLKDEILFCDDIEEQLSPARGRNLRDTFVALEKNLRREHRALIATTSSEFALRLLESDAVTFDTAMLALPCLDSDSAADFRRLLFTVQTENPSVLGTELLEEDQAMRLQTECIGLPGLMFRQLEYAEQLAHANGRNAVKPSDLREAALEAFKLRTILEELRALHTALDNSPCAFRSLAIEFGLNEEQMTLAFGP